MDFFFTTEYTEAGESILKITERSSVISVWERSDLSVCSVVKWGLGISRVEHKDRFGRYRRFGSLESAAENPPQFIKFGGRFG